MPTSVPARKLCAAFHAEVVTPLLSGLPHVAALRGGAGRGRAEGLPAREVALVEAYGGVARERARRLRALYDDGT